MKTFDDIRTELVQNLNLVEDIKTGNKLSVDVNDATDILAIFTNYIASSLTFINDQVLKLRNSLNPYKASNNELSDVVQYRNLTRKIGTATTSTVVFEGAKDTVIAEGLKLTNNDRNKIFLTTEEVIIPEAGEISVLCKSEVVGEVALNENELTTIVDSTAFDLGIKSCSKGNLGTNSENDINLHQRLKSLDSTIGGFLNIIDSSLLNFPGINYAKTFIGVSESPKLNFGEILVTVSGTASDEDIANIIFNSNNFWYSTTGQIEKTVKSSVFDREFIVRFTRLAPTQVLTLNISFFVYDESTYDEASLKSQLAEKANNFIINYAPESKLLLVDLASYLQTFNLCAITKITSNNADFVVVEKDKLLSTDVQHITLTKLGT